MHISLFIYTYVYMYSTYVYILYTHPWEAIELPMGHTYDTWEG